MKSTYENIKIITFKPGSRWRGLASAELPADVRCKPAQWFDFLSSLSEPDALFKNPAQVIKSEGPNCVVVKSLKIDDESLTVVLKRHFQGSGFRNFFRSFQMPKAFRNFMTALRLLSLGIPVVPPLASLAEKKNLQTIQSIYITPYFKNCPDLYGFAAKQFPQLPASIKKRLCFQFAQVLASIHNNGLWHRDAKAGNFIVSAVSDNEYKILLVDMDGIKKYFFASAKKQFCSLWRPAASLLQLNTVSRVDYYRTFTAYCDLTGISTESRRNIYRRIAARARVKYLQSAMKMK